MSNHQNGIIWTVETKFVDLDTGEIIPRKKAENKHNYIIVKTTKDETIFNEKGTKATIYYTKQCRRQPQQRINFN